MRWEGGASTRRKGLGATSIEVKFHRPDPGYTGRLEEEERKYYNERKRGGQIEVASQEPI